MSITRLTEKRVEKVWGRRGLPSIFGGTYEGKEPLGEIWLELPGATDAELLVKYLFTSERLSIQVHPDDEAARRVGLTRGKEEAWIILRAEPGAMIGLGLRKRVDREELRIAAVDGTIEELIHWCPANVGDIIYLPAGTVHALGAGLTLIEIQQNSNATYRLFDYGRPRELHLDEGIAVSIPEPYEAPMKPYFRSLGRQICAEGRAFVLERWSVIDASTLLASKAAPVWLVPVTGIGKLAGKRISPGSVWHVDEPSSLELADGSELFIAYAGPNVRDALMTTNFDADEFLSTEKSQMYG